MRNKLFAGLRARLVQHRRNYAAWLDLQSRIARAEDRQNSEEERRRNFHAYPFRELGRQLLIQRYSRLLDLSWEDRWDIWEGQDSRWYGSVRGLDGWILTGPMGTKENIQTLTEYMDGETRREAASELHKLQNWRDYYGKG
jgi:hypothetical protein